MAITNHQNLLDLYRKFANMYRKTAIGSDEIVDFFLGQKIGKWQISTWRKPPN